MKTKLMLNLATLLCVTFTTELVAQPTAFTYQGQLTDNGTPANGFFDIFTELWDASSGGAPVGTTITNTAVAVSNGLFTVSLDFGPGAFDGSDRWLEIGVATNGAGLFSTLSPRQKIGSTPYAIRAAGISGTVAASQLTGTLSSNHIGAGTITSLMLANGSVGTDQLVAGSVFRGSFAGDAGSLSNLNLAANSSGTIQFGSFQFSSAPSVGFTTYSITTADVNADGHLDLIGVSYTDFTLSVLTNDGSAGFFLSATYGVGDYPYSVAAADLNGDGSVDLISADSEDSALTVLTNNGSGGFTISSTNTVGGGPFSVLATDVNGDGWPDLVSANVSDDTLTVLTNNGSGGFALSSSPVVGTDPNSVTAADVNGDEHVDLISANSGVNTLSVLTNDGNGGFVLFSTQAVGAAPISVTAADVNGDGWLDLIAANFDTSNLTVLTNAGGSGFGLSSSPGVGFAPASVVAADVNGDGALDLISANFNSDSLSVLTNDGAGGFALATSLAVGTAPVSVTAADVNADGRVDLISSHAVSSTLSVFLNSLMVRGSFAGSGAGLSNLNASLMTTGTVADARLSSNVALLNTPQTFTADKTFGLGAQVFSHSGSVSAPGLSFNGDSNTGLFRPAADTIALTTGGSEQLRVTSSGMVGIGTVTPGATVTISRPVQAASHQLELRNVGSIQSPNFDGIRFTQDADGGTELAAINVKYRNTGRPDLSFSVRDTPDALFIHGSYNNQDGNVGIGTNSPSQKLHVVGNILATGTVTGSSDRNVKENFAVVDAQDVLAKVAAMPIQRWNYIGEDTPHVGPVAQDFYGAFQVGMDDKHISMVDADGVALAAIQGLNQKLEQKESEITELKARLDKLEQLLNEKLNGGAL